MSGKHLRMLSFLIAALLLSGCAATLPGGTDPPAGSFRVSIDSARDGRQRGFLLHIPAKYRRDTPLPLVVVVHGAFSTGRQTEKETGFSDLADNEQFLVAYPEGVGLFGLLQHWNAGFCCGRAADEQLDDVGFLSRVIAAVRRNLAVDPERIYMAGMSNGGMLTYRYAAERSGELAAAAVVSAAIGGSIDNGKEPWRLPRPESVVPMIVYHGMDDDNIPVMGGISPRKKGKRSYQPFSEAIEFWKRANGCGSDGVETVFRDGSEKHLRWELCRDGSAVESVLLTGWGHQWPAPWFTNRLQSGHPLRGLDATKQIWRFFKGFRRSAP